MKITLPLPPSTNHLYANVRGIGRVKTVRYKQWIKAADGYLLAQKRDLTPIAGPVELTVFINPKTRGDTSNRIKAAEDYLVSRELTDDDIHTWKVSCERTQFVPEGECVVFVMPLGGQSNDPGISE